MITEDYVSFEIAKLLREKSFDERCKYVWKLDKANDPQDNDGISKICAERFMEGESFVDNSDIKKVFEYEDWFEDYHKVYLCPTIQMATKWLVQEYRLYVNVTPNVVDFYWTEKWNSYVEVLTKRYPLGKFIGTFNSPEEACEAAIKYCLENLI